MAEIKHINRKELIDILTKDGTYKELKKAVAEKEWTEEEKNKVLDYLSFECKTEKDKKRSEDMFKDILKDIKSRPVQMDPSEELKDWKALRENLANSVNEATQEKNAKYVDWVKLSKGAEFFKEGNYPQELVSHLEKKYMQATRALDITTKQVSALSLMYAEATSMTAQLTAKRMATPLMDLLKDIKEQWKSIDVAGYFKAISASSKTYNETKHLTNHFLLNNTTLRFHYNAARDSVAKINKYEQKLAKIEEKLVKKANKVLESEYGLYKKSQYFSKGHKVINAPQKVNSLEEAKKILAERKMDEGLVTKRQLYVYNKKSALRDIAKERVDNQLNIIKDIYKDRRDKAQALGKEIREKEKLGEFGHSKIAANKLGKAYDALIDEIENKTYADRNSLDKDLAQYIEKNHKELFNDEPERE